MIGENVFISCLQEDEDLDDDLDDENDDIDEDEDEYYDEEEEEDNSRRNVKKRSVPKHGGFILDEAGDQHTGFC